MQQQVKTALAYGGVLMIWGTTPLAIQWSSAGLDYLLSVSLRMGVAAILSVALVFVLEKKLPFNLPALASYAAGSIGIYGGMLCVYWAAPYVPSGLISIMYGLAPVFIGVQAYYLLGENFGTRKLAGVLLSIIGLIVVFYDSLQVSGINLYAVVALLMSVLLYTLCGVLTKKVEAPVSPLQQTSGTLFMSSIAYLVTCAILQPSLPEQLSMRAGVSLIYLAAICSVLGFFLYFYVLKVSSAGSVSLITLVAPVIALTLGSLLNGEQFSVSLLLGAGFIALGLIAYQWPVLAELVFNKQEPLNNPEALPE